MAELDPAHRNILEHELAQVRAQKARLATTEEYLLDRLGLTADDAPASDAASQNGGAQTERRKLGASANVADAVNPMQYYGLSVTKGAAEVLDMVGRDRPLRSREIYEALVKGGLSPKNVEVVGKMLKRDKRFHQVKRGMWGLSHWYPASVLARGAADDDLQPELNEDLEADGETPGDENGVSAEDE